MPTTVKPFSLQTVN